MHVYRERSFACFLYQMPTRCLNLDVGRILPVFIPFHSILQVRCYAYQVTRRRCIFSEFQLLKRTLMRKKQKLAWATSWDALQNISDGISDPSFHTWSLACGNHYAILHPSNYPILVYEVWWPWAGKSKFFVGVDEMTHVQKKVLCLRWCSWLQKDISTNTASI